MTPERFRRLRETLDRRQPDLTVVLENVHKPHNYSAILRSCDAVGVLTAHAISPRGAVKGSRTIAMGSQRWVRSVTHVTTAEALRRIRAEGMRLLAADLRPQAVDFREVDFTLPTAILMGEEKHGISPEAAAAVDDFIIIPMVGMVASLNVSVAAALILFEAQRQRREAGLYEQPRVDAETYRRTLFEWAYPEIADYCRQEGAAYPRLSEDGDLLDPLPR